MGVSKSHSSRWELGLGWTIAFATIFIPESIVDRGMLIVSITSASMLWLLLTDLKPKKATRKFWLTAVGTVLAHASGWTIFVRTMQPSNRAVILTILMGEGIVVYLIFQSIGSNGVGSRSG